MTKPGNEQTLCMPNLYQNPVTNQNTRIYGTNNYTFIAIMRYHIIRIIPPKPRIYAKRATNYACSRHSNVPSHLPHVRCEYDLRHHQKDIFSQQADNNLTQPIFQIRLRNHCEWAYYGHIKFAHSNSNRHCRECAVECQVHQSRS